MMSNEKIELYKVRDFSDRINVVFEFIKQNGKPIAKNLLYFIPIYLIASIPIGLFQTSLLSYTPGMDFAYIFTGAYFMALLANLLITFSGLIVSVFVVSYVAEYEKSENIDAIDISKVWSRVKDSLLGVIGGGFLMGLAVFVGFLLCFFPGVWLAISFSLFIPAYVISKDKEISLSAVDAISESFNLVKKDWFGAFAFLFVIGIIVMLFGVALSIPTQIISSMSLFSHTDDNVFLSAIIVLFSSLSLIASLFFSAISSVALAVLYFDFVERNEGVSVQRRISDIGQESDGNKF